nr:PREDICTED: rhomboid-related protein 4-like [Bemisia tabaci]
MSRSNRRANRGLEWGVALLLSELYRTGYDVIPPVTLATVVGQILLYIGVINVPWTQSEVCLSAAHVLKGKDYRRLLWSTFEHGDDMHLYYNMISFMVKGRTLEGKYGSANFGFLLAFLCAITSCSYVVLALIGAQIMDDPYIMKSCAIGFSGVLFALKVVTTQEDPRGYTNVAGFLVPVKYAAWAELLAINMLVPNSSFLGHLAGIVAGLIYTKTIIGRLVDNIIRNITGERIYHNYC